MKGLNFLLVLVGACLLLSGCRRSGLQVQEVYHMLSVGDVVLVTSGDWSSQSSKSSDSSLVARSSVFDAGYSLEFAEVDLGDGLSLSAEEGWIGDLAHADLSDSTLAQQHVDFVSKGTPITNASGVNSFLIQLFNSGSAAWGAGVPLTESFTATKGGNSYSLSSSYNWLSDTDKVSLFAFTPVPSADNGLSVGANGYTVRYVVPTDVTKQPDLSSALAQTDVINTDGKQHMRNFNFDHRLTAVGVAIHGWNVKVTKVEVLGVSFDGTYDLSSGVWVLAAASGSRTMGVNSGKVPTDGYLSGEKTWTDATNANGYMMMIPQVLASTAELKVTYEGVSGNTDKGTITANISSLTGGAWRAGGKVTYNIQLKMAPNISTTALTMPWKAGYTTELPVVFGTHDPNDEYLFTWSDPWNTIHQGAVKVGNTNGGGGTGYKTAARSIVPTTSELWFFTKVDNTITTTNRTSTVTVSGRRTAAKSFVVTQTRKPSVVVSPAAPTESLVASGGKTYTVNVKSNYPWKATSTAGGVTIDPEIGTSAEGTPAAGTNVTITVPVNNDAASRAVGARFETTNDGGVAAFVLGTNWAGTQAGLVLAGSDPAAIAQPDKSTTVLSFTGNPSVAWSISATPAWITASPTNGTAPAAAAQNVTLTATENATGAVRTGVLAIKMGSVTRNFTITQNASSISISTATASMVAATSSAQAFTVTVGSGTPWTVANDSGGWLTNTTEKDAGSDKAQGVTLAAAANNTNAAREATVTVTAGGKKVICKVTQAAPAAADFTTTFTNYTSGDAGSWASGNKAVTPAAGLQWKLTGDAGVTVSPTVTPQTGAVTNASASVGANNTNSARTLKYYIWYGTLNSLKTEYTITQAAPVVNITPVAQNVVWNATSATFDLVVPSFNDGVIYTLAAGSNATGVVPSGAQTVSGTNIHSKTVRVNFAANTGAARSIVATVRYGASLTKTHTITQAGGLTIDKKLPGETIPSAGKSYTVKVTTGSAWTAVASAGTTVSPAGGSGAATVTVTVADNPSVTTTRAAKVDFKLGSDVLATWSGTQAVADVALTLSSHSFSATAKEWRTTFTVNSNVPFTPTYSSDVESDLGTGVQQPVTGKTVTMRWKSQDLAPAAARTHTMTFTPNPNNPASSQTRVFTVTQAATLPTLTVSPSVPSGTIPKGGATYEIRVASNTTYSVTGTNATFGLTSSLYQLGDVVVAPSPVGTASREVKVVFTTTANAGHPAVTQTWTGTQEVNPPTNCYTTPLPGYPNTYVALTDNGAAIWQSAGIRCENWGGRLPTSDELLTLYQNRGGYGTFEASWYWSSSTNNSTSVYCVNFRDGSYGYYTSNTDTYVRVRCVKDAK